MADEDPSLGFELCRRLEGHRNVQGNPSICRWRTVENRQKRFSQIGGGGFLHARLSPTPCIDPLEGARMWLPNRWTDASLTGPARNGFSSQSHLERAFRAPIHVAGPHARVDAN